jgi:hypothetical protein
MPHNETVQKFLDILGPFYEYVDENDEQINNNDLNTSDLNGLNENDLIINEKITKQNGFINNTNPINNDLSG